MKIKNVLKSLLLIVLMVFAITLTGCKDSNLVNTSYRYDDTGYKFGNMSFKEEPVKEIHIDWLVGDVEIYRSGNEKEVVIQEDIDMEVEDKYRVHFLLKDGILDIKFVKSMSILKRQFNLKRVRVYVPETVEKVYINSVDAEINITDAKIKSIQIDNISGDMDIKNIECDEMNIKSRSGQIMLFNNKILNNNISSVSGNIGLSYVSMPNSLNLNSESGNINLYVKKDDNLTIKFDNVSGNFKTNLEYTVDGDLFVFNKKTNYFNIKTNSGNLSVLTK